MRGEEDGRGQEIPRSSGGLALGRTEWSYTWCNILHNSVMITRTIAATASQICLLWPIHTALYDRPLVALPRTWCLQVTSRAEHFKPVYLATSPQRLTFGEMAGAAELRCCGPRGTRTALRKLLTPILSTQLACASLTHTGLLMATANETGLEKEENNC